MYPHPIAYLNSNNGNSILAFGDGPQFSLNAFSVFEDLQGFVDVHKGEYIFTCLCYDIKNRIELLKSGNKDLQEFPDVLAWVPACVVRFENGRLEYVQGKKTNDTEAFIQSFLEQQNKGNYASLPYELKPRTSKEKYLETVVRLKEDIQQGNIYEVNYCQEFFAKNVDIPDPLEVYFKLNKLTKAPYSAFIQLDKFNLFCGSPERFIRREGNKLISSPIKGTHKRGETPEEDNDFKIALFNDKKERSENVMIVDLVRNDLSRIATKGSVKVDELFGIYTFETVHQMISTISCELKENVKFTQIIKASFPMGSMTGAPKVSAMKLIEKYEDFRRGIYSGSIGFIAPNGNFDFNVVIRTMIYNTDKKYLSCPVGGAITINSSPEKEYEECLIKVKGILDRMYAKS